MRQRAAKTAQETPHAKPRRASSTLRRATRARAMLASSTISQPLRAQSSSIERRRWGPDGTDFPMLGFLVARGFYQYQVRVRCLAFVVLGGEIERVKGKVACCEEHSLHSDGQITLLNCSIGN